MQQLDSVVPPTFYPTAQPTRRVSQAGAITGGVLAGLFSSYRRHAVYVDAEKRPDSGEAGNRKSADTSTNTHRPDIAQKAVSVVDRPNYHSISVWDAAASRLKPVPKARLSQHCGSAGIEHRVKLHSGPELSAVTYRVLDRISVRPVRPRGTDQQMTTQQGQPGPLLQ